MEGLRTVAVAHLYPLPLTFASRSTFHSAVLTEEKTILSLEIDSQVVIVVWDFVNNRYTKWEFGADQATGFGTRWEVCSCLARFCTPVIEFCHAQVACHAEFIIHLTRSGAWGYKPPLPLQPILDGQIFIPHGEPYTLAVNGPAPTFSFNHPHDYLNAEDPPPFDGFHTLQHQHSSHHGAFLYDISWAPGAWADASQSTESASRPGELETPISAEAGHR